MCTFTRSHFHNGDHINNNNNNDDSDNGHNNKMLLTAFHLARGGGRSSAQTSKSVEEFTQNPEDFHH